MTKKKTDLLPASKVLQSLLGNGKSALSDQFLRWRIWRYWKDIAGPSLGEACEPVDFDRGQLFLWVKSSPRLQEVRFFTETLRKKVNEHVGREWVRSIRLTLDRRGTPTADRVSPEFKRYLDEEPEA